MSKRLPASERNLRKPHYSISIQVFVRVGSIFTTFKDAVDWMLNNAVTGLEGFLICPSCWVSDLVYADDIAIFGPSCETVQPILIHVNKQTRVVGLRLSASKATKI